MKCEKCGAKLAVDGKFCPQCGQSTLLPPKTNPLAPTESKAGQGAERTTLSIGDNHTTVMALGLAVLATLAVGYFYWGSGYILLVAILVGGAFWLLVPSGTFTCYQCKQSSTFRSFDVKEEHGPDAALKGLAGAFFGTMLCGPCGTIGGANAGLGQKQKHIICPKCRSRNVLLASQVELKPVSASNELIWLIRQYQRLLSSILNRQCRFHPSCSEFGIRAIEKHGRWEGLRRTLTRVNRCTPINLGPALDLP